jgi:glycosyltransferase involved in cell wall biosynthesis
MYQGDKRDIREALAFGLACIRLMRVRADVIDVDHMPFFPIFGAWVSHFFYRRPLIGTWHEALSKEDWQTYMGNAGIIAFMIERLSTKLPKHIIAASSHTKHNLSRLHHRSRSAMVVASGIDTAALARIKPAAEPCDILYVGRLVKDKRVDILLKAFVHVLAARPDTRLVIVGDGIERRNLESLTAMLGIADHVTFTGRVSLDAAKDLIEHGVTGSIAQPTPEAFAAACMRWLDAAPNPERMAKSARQFDWETLTSTLETHYESWGAARA